MVFFINNPCKKTVIERNFHSDDSGISETSSPVNCLSANIKKINEGNKVVNTPSTHKEHLYIGPNCYNLTPEPPEQKLMTRTVSTPLLSAIRAPRKFKFQYLALTTFKIYINTFPFKK